MTLSATTKALILLLIAVFYACNNTQKGAASLASFIKQVNASCPSKVDSETQLDSIELEKGNTLTYNYTLINVSAFAVDTHQFYQHLWPGILSTIRVSPQMQKLRDTKMTVQYRYRDAYKRHIYTFRVLPEDYQ